MKTEQSIPKGRIMDVMKALESIDVKAPVSAGDVVLKDVAGLGVNIVANKIGGAINKAKYRIQNRHIAVSADVERRSAVTRIGIA